MALLVEKEENFIMKIFIKIILLITMTSLPMILSNCAGPGHVTVGVGVGVGGPWVGPYGHPGGTVWVGRPLTPVYYHIQPLEDKGIELVWKLDYEEHKKSRNQGSKDSR
jgi:hypothetical protein